ncbi:MAG: VacJ family lipoprotein [Nitrospirae bacterium]|nr:VacJ family lipoprotein [Nitrospirota bacterium]
MSRKIYIAGMLVIMILTLCPTAMRHDSAAAAEDAAKDAGSNGLQEKEQTELAEENGIADPLEPLNRLFFNFNDRLYFWVLKPAANGYIFLVPEWGRIRVRNVFHNISTPVRFVNALLQFKVEKAARELAHFIVNSTAGVGGMFDIPLDNPGARGSEEDLGQTLAVYGIGNGFYIVIPVLGPSSLRDTAGLAGDYFLDPVSYISPSGDQLIVRSYDRVNDTSLKIGEYEDLKESAIDPYISVKDAYNQHRRSRVKE